MSEVKNAGKKQRIQQKPTASKTFKMLKDNKELADRIAGKTLWEVGQMFGLSDEDLSIEEDDRVIKKTGKSVIIKSLGIKIDGQLYKANFSTGFNYEKMEDIDWLLSCEFRQGYQFAYEADGETPAFENDGVTRKFDMLKPYLNFGNPSGLTSTRSNALFAEMTEDEKAAASVNA